jgi:cysteine-rich repeat protein
MRSLFLLLWSSACSAPVAVIEVSDSDAAWEGPLLQAPPPPTMTLTLDNVVAGRPAALHLSGAAPGAEIYIAYSRAGLGDGACPSVFDGGCLGLLSPAQRSPILLQADESGEASGLFVTPRGWAGTYVGLQAVTVEPVVAFSNTPGRPIAAPGTTILPHADSDGDGYTVAQGDCGDADDRFAPLLEDLEGDGRDLNCDDVDGCLLTCGSSICGNGVIEGDEQCDDANDVPEDGCEDDCTITVDDVVLCAPGVITDCVDGTGLALWLRADDLAAGAVSLWPDASGQDNDAAQASGSRQPAVAAVLNGHHAVRFDGVDDRLDVATNVLGAGTVPSTTFVILAARSTHAHVVGTGSSDAGFLDTYGMGLTVAGGRAVSKANSNSSGLRLAAASGLGTGPRLVTLVTSAAGSSIAVDGEPQGLSATAPNPHGTYTRTTLGASDGVAAGNARDPLNGDIAEVIVFHRELSAEERRLVEEGLAAYYELELYEDTDCAGTPGGTATWDACGVCEGDGSSCAFVSAYGPSLWLRGDDLAGAGTSVGAWPDASGSGNHATQGASSAQPYVGGGQIGGHMAVRFDGVNDRLDLATNLFGSGGFPKTVFVVAQTYDVDGHVVGTGSSSAGLVDAYGSGIVIHDSEPAMKANSNGTGLFYAGNLAQTGAPSLISAALQSGASDLQVDGAAVGASAVTLSPFAYTRSTLGASDGSASNAARDPFDGLIAEVLVYDRVLTPQERQDVSMYLADRYGLALAPAGSVGGERLLLQAQSFAGLPDATAVTAWDDLSASGNDASQSNSSNRPLVFTVGGLPWVRFDGVNDRLDLASNLFSSSNYPMTVLAVLRSTDASAHVLGTGSSDAGFLTSYGSGLVVDGGFPTAKANSNSSGLYLKATTSRVDDGGVHIVTLRTQSGGSTVHVDGVLRGSSATAPNPHGYGKSTVGASDGASSGNARDPFAGDLAEIFVYGFVLTDAQREQKEEELAARYGVTLP